MSKEDVLDIIIILFMSCASYYIGYQDALVDQAKAKVVNEKKVARIAYIGTKNSKGEE